MPLFLYFLFFCYNTYNHSRITIAKGPSPYLHSCRLSGRNLPGVPSRDSNSGLPYSKPAHYQLSCAAPLLSCAAPLYIPVARRCRVAPNPVPNIDDSLSSCSWLTASSAMWMMSCIQCFQFCFSFFMSKKNVGEQFQFFGAITFSNRKTVFASAGCI